MSDSLTSGSLIGVDEEREHNFDGITEFDNRLPNWWLWSFYLACIFSVFYWAAYHVLGFAPLPEKALANELAAIAAAEEAAGTVTDVTDEALLTLMADEKVVAKGKAVFEANCVACHKADGGGLVGPNLTDKFWIHGGRPTQIYDLIRKGVPEKGMLTWEPILKIPRCQQVTAYILRMRNTEVAGGKAPEGEPYDGE